VCRQLKTLTGEWLVSAARDIAQWRAEIIAEHRAIAETAWAEFAKSQESKPGDPAYLREVREALLAIREVLGLDAAKRFDGVLRPGMPADERPLELMTDDDLLRIASREVPQIAVDCGCGIAAPPERSPDAA